MESVTIDQLKNMYIHTTDDVFERMCQIPPCTKIEMSLTKKIEQISAQESSQDVLLNTEKLWNDILLFNITNALRPVVYEFIALLNKDMNEYATAIISGGEAFNLIVSPEDRKLTSDIDTKVIVCQKISNDPYGFLNFIHLFWYDCLEKRLNWLHDNYKIIYDKYLLPIQQIPPLSDFQVQFFTPEDVKRGYLPFRKRLTIMPKNIQSEGRLVLFDIYLYAIDFYMKSSQKLELKRSEKNGTVEYKYTTKLITEEETYLSGLIDLPIMREGFLGYDAYEGAVEKIIMGSTGLSSKPSFEIPTVNTYTYKLTGKLYTGLEGQEFDRARQTPTWLGSQQTAMLYSIPLKVGRITKAMLGKVYMLNVEKPLTLIDITNEEFLYEFAQRLLNMYDVENVNKIELAVKETDSNCYKYLLRALSALGYINVYVQKRFFDYFVQDTFQNYYKDNFESLCRAKVMVKGQRFSERECDFELGQWIRYFWPNVDGYFGKHVESCWHGPNGFHAEVCLFNTKQKQALLSTVQEHTITVSEYYKFKNSGFKITDDEILLSEGNNIKFREQNYGLLLPRLRKRRVEPAVEDIKRNRVERGGQPNAIPRSRNTPTKAIYGLLLKENKVLAPRSNTNASSPGFRANSTSSVDFDLNEVEVNTIIQQRQKVDKKEIDYKSWLSAFEKDLANDLQIARGGSTILNGANAHTRIMATLASIK